MDGLIRGRIVHYAYCAADLPECKQKLAGTVIPAMVVCDPVADSDDGRVNLTGFTDGPNHGLGLVIRLESRPYSIHGEPGTWHWPQDTIQPKSEPSTPMADSTIVSLTPAEPPAPVPPVEQPTEPTIKPAANATEAAATL